MPGRPTLRNDSVWCLRWTCSDIPIADWVCLYNNWGFLSLCRNKKWNQNSSFLLLTLFSWKELHFSFFFFSFPLSQQNIQIGCHFRMYSVIQLQVWLSNVYFCLVFWISSTISQVHWYIPVALCHSSNTEQSWTWLTRLFKVGLWSLWATGMVQSSWSVLSVYPGVNCLLATKYDCQTVPLGYS